MINCRLYHGLVFLFFVSLLIMIDCVSNTLYLVGYLCVLGPLCHLSVLMAGLISSHTFSTLVASHASRVFTLGSLGVSG